ncbi:MAG: TraR/DksA family transcriptional regulator [Planctomycetota bacterium]
MSRQESLKKLRTTLVRRRDALRRALDGDLSLLQDLHGQKTGDPLDAAADTIQDELNSQLVEVEARELSAIEEAIDRLESGDYGDCEACGKPIPITRLRAVPYATDCIGCRRRAEERNNVAGVVEWNRVFDAPEVDTV